jgi:hypothetical protein
MFFTAAETTCPPTAFDSLALLPKNEMRLAVLNAKLRERQLGKA